MGYTTDFDGHFTITPALKPEQVEFLTKLASTRRMKRNLPAKYGVEGEFYVNSEADFGQDFNNDNVISGNQPPSTQPSLWCQWTPSEDGSRLEWDGGEKFYEYIAWLTYIDDKILKPNGYMLAGTVDFQGEESDDVGTIAKVDDKWTTVALVSGGPLQLGA